MPKTSPPISINTVQDQLVQELGDQLDWLEKYQYLINLGKQHPRLEKEFKTDRYAVEGCQSQVWIHTKLDQGRMRVRADSDALITRGIIALLVRVFDGQTPQDAAAADLYFIRDIGLDQNLSPSRANGLASIIRNMKSTAADLSDR